MGDNWLLAVFFICLAAASIAADFSKHPDCIAFCTNIASAGRAD